MVQMVVEFPCALQKQSISKYFSKMIVKAKWNKTVNDLIESIALKDLLKENETKTKTRHLKYKTLEMQQYLKENKNTNISKLIYKIRSGTLNIKAWKPWNYEDNPCVMCHTAVSCNTQMKASGKQVFLSFRSYYPLYGYNYKSQKVYFYK